MSSKTIKTEVKARNDELASKNDITLVKNDIILVKNDIILLKHLIKNTQTLVYGLAAVTIAGFSYVYSLLNTIISKLG